MATKKRRRGKGLDTVYRLPSAVGPLWSIAWVVNRTKVYEHGFPDEDTGRRALAVKIGDLAAGRGGLKAPQSAGRLAGLVRRMKDFPPGPVI